MHSTDTQVAHRSATCTENEQSLHLPFDLLSQQSAAHCSQHSGSTADQQQKGRDRQCRNKQKPPQNKKKKNPPSRILGLVLSQAVIYFLILQAPQEQAYQGTGGITDGVYLTGVDKSLVALAMSGQ